MAIAVVFATNSIVFDKKIESVYNICNKGKTEWKRFAEFIK